MDSSLSFGQSEPISTCYTGHVAGHQPISDPYFLIRFLVGTGSHHHSVSSNQMCGVAILDDHVSRTAVTGPHVLSGHGNLRERGVREEWEL